jgi:hypothetical protein
LQGGRLRYVGALGTAVEEESPIGLREYSYDVTFPYGSCGLIGAAPGDVTKKGAALMRTL